MVQILLMSISYGSFLVLMMPATINGVIGAAVLYVLGLGLMGYKKWHKKNWVENKDYVLLLFALLEAVSMGLRFRDRWLYSSAMNTVASLVHIPTGTLLLIGAAVLMVLSYFFLYILLLSVKKGLVLVYQKDHFAGEMLSCLLAAVMTVCMVQDMVSAPVLQLGLLKFSVNVLIVFLMILYLYCLFGRVVISVLIGVCSFMVLSSINVYVFRFRARLFEPVDIFSAGTAMNVADNYSLFPIPIRMIFGWVRFVVLLLVLHRLQSRVCRRAPTLKRRLGLLAAGIAGSVLVGCYAQNLKTYHWHDEGARFNGYILDFVSKFKEISVPKPDHYSLELIGELADQYAEDGTGSGGGATKQPHIIVIMDEAFADMSVVGEFTTNMDVMPFVSSLKQDTIRGYALASVYGGNTANSEYEFLTGNSLAWLSPNSVPYQQYISSPTYSMVSYLKDFYDYTCVAMHPFEASGWNRPEVYKNFGFDESYFLEAFPQEDYVRCYISDQEMFEFLIETYEEKKEEPLFLFGVTMQNHGGYSYVGDNFVKHIELSDHAGAYPDVEQYLSLVYETDRAVEYLITYFQSVDEDVVIVFFGDHYPKVDESFYEMISGSAEDSLDEQQKRFQVPFFIWANYDLQEEYIECTSLNYLSSYVYEAAGLALPAYNQFLREMEAVIPAINANGFYSLTNECYAPVAKADGEERRWLELYEALLYNSIADLENRNEAFFPVMKD